MGHFAKLCQVTLPANTSRPFTLGAVPACMLSHLQLFTTPWTVARQAPLRLKFSRQEYWSELPFPPPRDLPDPGIKPTSPTSPALAGISFTTEPHGKPLGAGGSDCKESACQRKRLGFDPWIGKIIWRRKWQLTPVFLPGKFQGHRSLAGYSPWSHERVRPGLATQQQQHTLA